MAFQPFLGVLHHRHFVRNEGRGLVSHFHIWWGRLLMVMGIINGGLGLQLALAPRSVIIGYSVASAVLFLAYVAAKVIGSCFLGPKRAQKNPNSDMSVSGNGRRYDDGSRGGNRQRPEPDMAYRGEGDYYSGRNEAPQQDRRNKSTGSGDIRTYFTSGSSANNHGASSVSPPVATTRSAMRPTPPGRPYEETGDQNRNRMRREERRYE